MAGLDKGEIAERFLKNNRPVVAQNMRQQRAHLGRDYELRPNDLPLLLDTRPLRRRLNPVF